MKCAKMELGMNGSIFECNFDMYGFLCEETWVKHLWKYVQSNGIVVKDKVGEISMLRENNRCITTHFARAYQAGLITKSEWLKANKCRKYLKVLTVADMASGNGQHIDANMWIGKRQYGGARTIY